MLTRYRAMLDELLNLEEGLTTFEVGFVDGLDRRDRAARGETGYQLTPAQAQTLCRIHRERIVEASGRAVEDGA